MSNPKHISEVMHQLLLDNPNDKYAQLLKHCPFMQIMMLKEGYISLDDLTDEQIDKLIAFDLLDANVKKEEDSHD